MRLPKNLTSPNFFLPVLLTLVLHYSSVAQEMYKTLIRDKKKIRTSYGIQVGEPTGFSMQFFRGKFCSGGRSYRTYLIGELNAGVEHLTNLPRAKFPTGNSWKSGGMRVEANVLVPLHLFMTRSSSVQVFAGAGLQTGTRRYGETGTEVITASGWNMLGRIESTATLMKINRVTAFITLYADLRFYRDFEPTFRYSAPSMGIRLKFVR